MISLFGRNSRATVPGRTRTATADWERGTQRGWLVLLLCSWIFVCQAQEGAVIFHLRNGDRITGRILSETADAVTISTSIAGAISLQKSEIERREPVKPAEMPAIAPAPAAGALPSPTPKADEPKSTPKPAEVSPSDPVAAAKPEPAFLGGARKFIAEWVGELRLGMNLGFSTKDRQTYTGRFKATHTRDELKNILDYNASYGRIEGVLSDNQMDGSWKTEYDFGENRRFHVYNAVGAGYDEIQQIDLRYDVGPGFGYKWLTRTNLVLKTEIGGNYQEQLFADDTRKTRYALRFAEDLTWQISNKLKLDEKFEFFPKFDDISDYRFRVEGNLSYLLRDNLTLNLTVIDIYDTAAPAGVSRNDLQIRSSLGIKF